MEENKNINEVNEAVAEVDASSMTDDELKQAITKQLEKVRNDGIIIGYKVAARTIIDIIAPWHNPNCSKREYERIFKKIEEFYGKALKQADSGVQDVTGASESDTTETVQN